MQVRAKIFPYPVINHNKGYSSYGDLDFELMFEPVENDAHYVLKGFKYSTNSETLKKMVSDKNVNVVLIAECSATVYRKSFPISDAPADIVLPKKDFTEKTEFSVFAYATRDFVLSSDEFDEDYQGIDYKIEKYDIVAADDGFYVTFRHEETEDSFAQSIFSIINEHTLAPGAYDVDTNSGKKITINLSDEDYKHYRLTYANVMYQEVFFSMLLIPALIEALAMCKAALSDGSKDLDDISNQYRWFRSIQAAYQKIKGSELTAEVFGQTPLAALAQMLLGNPIGTALDKLVNDSKNSIGEEE